MSVKAQTDFYKCMLYVKELVDEGAICRAAAKNGIKAPNLSKLLKRAELFVSEPLFYRTPHGVVPLKAAVEIAQKMRAVQKLMSSISSLKNNPKTQQNPLKLYVSKGLQIASLEDFSEPVQISSKKSEADVIVSTNKPKRAGSMIAIENKLGQNIRQTVWVCAQNNARAAALARFIVLRFHR
ncbi:MAG: LysR family transcriptional regulator [Alphaproteobacteria bacterium]|nr:LysR family transcriptional regulator [Alphaproteobacteria bacterium]